MATFLLRTAFHNLPHSNDLLLAGRVYPLTTTIKAGDRLVFGKIKVRVQEAVVSASAYEGVILTIDEDSRESLKRAGIVLADLYGTEIQLEKAISDSGAV